MTIKNLLLLVSALFLLVPYVFAKEGKPECLQWGVEVSPRMTIDSGDSV